MAKLWHYQANILQEPFSVTNAESIPNVIYFRWLKHQVKFISWFKMAKINSSPQKNFFKFPVLAAQLTGTFPLSLILEKDDQYHLKFTWTGIGTLTILLRVCIYLGVGRIVGTKSDALWSHYGGWSGTLAISEILMQGSVVYGDVAWITLLLYRRRNLDKFVTSLSTLMTQISDHVYPNGEEQQTDYQEIYKQSKFISLIFLAICSLGLFFFLPAATIFIINVASIFQGSIRWFEMVVLLGYFCFTFQFRLISFYFCVAVIFALKSGFILLQKNLQRVFHSRPSSNIIMQEMRWTLNNYKQVEIFLKQFHFFFNFQLILGVSTILIGFLNEAFELLCIFMGRRSGTGFTTWQQPISYFSMLLGNFLVFYLLCDVTSGLTKQAQECIWTLRSFPNMHLLPEEEKEKMLLFYVEKATQPPTISPYDLFTFGRHLLPTVIEKIKFLN